MARLLVVDDEPNILYSLARGLQSDGLEVWTARTAQEGIEAARGQPPDAVVLDVRLPDLSGLDAFDRLREADPRLPVIFITAYACTETAIEAMKRGAFDYLLKPVDIRRLKELVGRALDLRRQRHTVSVPGVNTEAASTANGIVGRSAAMQEVYKAVGRVAAQNVTVLILGESGTGKELVARAIHRHSRRAGRPLVAVNSAALAENLVESELFGHERGAFTGADRRHVGKFEQADSGTLFLDEVGDLSPTAQAKLLRLLQEQQFERVGGSEAVRTDVRVIAATNQDLDGLVAAGRFREDLYYRLHVYGIRLPPLRQRPGDVPLLVDHFLRAFNRQFGRDVRFVTAEAMRLLEAHPWPGNVRELQSAIKHALLHAPGDALDPGCLPGPLQGPAAAQPAGDAEGLNVTRLVDGLLRSGATGFYQKVLARVEHEILARALRHVGGNQRRASQLLGISRSTLRAKLPVQNPAHPEGA